MILHSNKLPTLPAGFDLVLNGLDNLEARRHVNRLAMATKVPLVESGTTGYLGQVSCLHRCVTWVGVFVHSTRSTAALLPLQ